MSKKTIAINLLVLLILDVVLGMVYSASLKPDPKRAMIESTEKAFRTWDSAFHHGLRPNFDGRAYWDGFYRMTTDNLAFKNRPGKRTELTKHGPRTVWLGDSFTEGVGIEYDQTFVGLFDKAYPEREMVNLGVVSYSPKLYKQKLRYFHRRGLEYDDLILCLDISDIQDELVYGGREQLVDTRKRPLYKTIQWLRSHSLIFRALQWVASKRDTYKRIVGREFKSSEERDKWTDNDKVFEEWGRMGLESATANMDTVVTMQRSLGRRMALVVYPWPNHIRNSSFRNRQTEHWSAFCARHGIAFVNLFDAFERECRRIGNEKVLSEYFIEKDVHWTKAGHAFIYRSLDSALRQNLPGTDGRPFLP
ncbi:MAG: SGNH/GDSL hydrolase family protein [Chitinophagia bacterium]|nr:SGNH/GDSL hydrolase family protein [Chitinophagia bacterium]